MKITMKTIIACLVILISVPSFAQEMKKEKGMKMAKAKENFEKMTNELGLSDNQAAEVKEILMEQKVKVKEARTSKEEMSKMNEVEKKAARKETLQKKEEILSNTNTRLASVLNPEQMKKYLEMVDAKKAQRKDDRKERVKHRPMKKGEMHQVEEGATNN